MNADDHSTPDSTTWRQDAGVRAGIALAAPVLAALFVPIAGALTDALDERSADVRFVAVSIAMAIPLVALRLARPGASRRSRIVHGALALPMLAAIALPRSWIAVSWLTSGVLFHALGATVHAARSAARAGTTTLTRASFAILSGGLSLFFTSVAFVVLFNTQLVVVPARLAHLHPARLEGERELSLFTDDGLRLGATYTPGRPGAPAVLLVHGVADGRTRAMPWAERLGGFGYHVLRIDLRAHGTSEGAVCTYGQREVLDVRAALDRLRAMPEIDRERIAVVGASMGGGTVLASAPSLRSRGVRALVLLAPAARYGPLVDRRVAFLGPFAPPSLRASAVLARAAGQIPMTDWSPAALVPRDALPALVFHGGADDTIPLASSRALAHEHASFRLIVLPRVGHAAIWNAVLDDASAWREVRALFARTIDR